MTDTYKLDIILIMKWSGTMNRKLDLKKDQEVIIRHINDKIRYIKDKSIENIDEWITKGTVLKIGRKYIEIDMRYISNEKFDIEFDYVQKTKYGSPDYKIYLSKEEIVEEIKCEELYDQIQNTFGRYGRNNNKFNLNQLQRIVDIIKEIK